MATIIAPTSIPATDCIGNSLATINSNFSTLFTDIQQLQQLIADIRNQDYVAKGWVNFSTDKNKKITINGKFNITSVTSTTTIAPTEYTITVPFTITGKPVLITTGRSPGNKNRPTYGVILSRTSTSVTFYCCTGVGTGDVYNDIEDINVVFY
jgi:hypothetical protein